MKLNRLKAVLLKKGISQTWLAKQLDMSFSMVNAYACNRIQPNLQTLQQFASILQVDLKDLITDAKMLVICMSVSWVVLEWYLSHDFIVGNRSLSSCKSAYYVLYKCCFLLFSQVTYQYTFVI